MILPEAFPVWLQIAGPASSIGLVSWLLWYFITKAVPRLEELHAATISDIQLKHAATVASIVLEFRSDSKEQRKAAAELAAAAIDLTRSGQSSLNSVTAAVTALLTEMARLGVNVYSSARVTEAGTRATEAGTKATEAVTKAHKDAT